MQAKYLRNLKSIPPKKVHFSWLLSEGLYIGLNEI